MKVNKVNHIAIIVDDIEQALIPYQKGLGLTPSEIEYNESYNVRIAFLPLGNTKLELVQPLGNEGEFVDFLHTSGGGLHHIAFEVDDIENTIQEMEDSSIPMQDTVPRVGAHNSSIAFAHPDGFNGVTVEFVRPRDQS